MRNYRLRSEVAVSSGCQNSVSICPIQSLEKPDPYASIGDGGNIRMERGNLPRPRRVGYARGFRGPRVPGFKLCATKFLLIPHHERESYGLSPSIRTVKIYRGPQPSGKATLLNRPQGWRQLVTKEHLAVYSGMNGSHQLRRCIGLQDVCGGT